MKSNKIQPQFIKKYNPRIGLIALATDFIIEKDFIKIIKDKDIDFFVNRIECYNPLSKENLIKMSEKVTDVAKAPVRTTDSTSPNIIKPKFPLAAPTTPITLSKLIIMSANKTL